MSRIISKLKSVNIIFQLLSSSLPGGLTTSGKLQFAECSCAGGAEAGEGLWEGSNGTGAGGHQGHHQMQPELDDLDNNLSCAVASTPGTPTVVHSSVTLFLSQLVLDGEWRDCVQVQGDTGQIRLRLEETISAVL